MEGTFSVFVLQLIWQKTKSAESGQWGFPLVWWLCWLVTHKSPYLNLNLYKLITHNANITCQDCSLQESMSSLSSGFSWNLNPLQGFAVPWDNWPHCTIVAHRLFLTNFTLSKSHQRRLSTPEKAVVLIEDLPHKLTETMIIIINKYLKN